ncbi:uncharacterized protein LOC129585640 isoform X2 [Paramacrobiotus metropolitanus]|uniref:uncharacterized protein LOC129585640 isoform X2 n=1 Tax=Paramacrobiotus metropolitanus TaxID=2943436 RepID=UPI002445C985|nr:uncharacterized protein LOC129585640 isoform X2 [Paramacrobiotus metropolitanus]
MSRKANTVLPEALTKGDYFRTRAPSRSPSRRPPRKGAMKNELTNGQAKSPSTETRLPQIAGTGSGSDKSDRTLNSADPMVGEVTVAFIDYRKDSITAKRNTNADPLHNVKVIQYIGQGKGASRNTHEFWMQSETAAKFPVNQQSISSRFPLNFGFYLDGQFFHRLNVCCLNKLRTNHSMIGTKAVHFKVVDCTNVVLCFRCKGHEFMLQSFKKGSNQTRSASVPRRFSEKPQMLPSPSGDSTGPDDQRNSRNNGTANILRSRSISRPRRRDQSPAPLQRTNTKTLGKTVAGAAAINGVVMPVVNGVRGINGPNENGGQESSSGRLSRGEEALEKALENYCEDRMSPSPDVEESATQVREAEPEEPNTAGMDSHGDSKYPRFVPPVDDEMEGSNKNAEQVTTVRDDGEQPTAEETPTVVRPASGNEETRTTVREDQAAAADAENNDATKTVVADDNGNNDTPTVIRDAEQEEGPYASMIAADDSETTTVVKDDTDVDSAPMVVRDVEPNNETTSGNAEAETRTEVRDDTSSTQATEPAEVSGGTEVDTRTEVRDDTTNIVQATQPALIRNVDNAEDMIELGHRRPSVISDSDEVTGQKARRGSNTSYMTETGDADEVTGQMPAEAIYHDKTQTQVRDAIEVDPALPSLAKEDPVAFAWPGTEPGKETMVREDKDEDVATEKNFEWPDASQRSGKGGKQRQISVDIVDEAPDSSRTATKTQVRDDRKDSVKKTSKQGSQESSTDFDPGRRPSTPHNAEEMIEQLGYVDEDRRESTVSLVNAPLLLRSATIESAGSGGEELTESARAARRERRAQMKPPPSPHSAEEFIDQLGYDTNEPDPLKPEIVK